MYFRFIFKPYVRGLRFTHLYSPISCALSIFYFFTTAGFPVFILAIYSIYLFLATFLLISFISHDIFITLPLLLRHCCVIGYFPFMFWVDFFFFSQGWLLYHQGDASIFLFFLIFLFGYTFFFPGYLFHFLHYGDALMSSAPLPHISSVFSGIHAVLIIYYATSTYVFPFRFFWFTDRIHLFHHTCNTFLYITHTLNLSFYPFYPPITESQLVN